MRFSGKLCRGGMVAFALLVGCGGPEVPLAPGEGLEAVGTTEAAVYEAPDSLLGLLGTYSRTWPLAASGELLTMTLTGVEAVDAVDGSYVRTVSRTCPVLGCNTETGTFFALPNNPAIGAVLVFKDLVGAERDYYTIVQIQRSAFTGKITGIILQKGGGTTSLPFTMVRVGL